MSVAIKFAKDEVNGRGYLFAEAWGARGLLGRSVNSHKTRNAAKADLLQRLTERRVEITDAMETLLREKFRRYA